MNKHIIKINYVSHDLTGGANDKDNLKSYLGQFTRSQKYYLPGANKKVADMLFGEDALAEDAAPAENTYTINVETMSGEKIKSVDITDANLDDTLIRFLAENEIGNYEEKITHGSLGRNRIISTTNPVLLREIEDTDGVYKVNLNSPLRGINSIPGKPQILRLGYETIKKMEIVEKVDIPDDITIVEFKVTPNHVDIVPEHFPPSVKKIIVYPNTGVGTPYNDSVLRLSVLPEELVELDLQGYGGPLSEFPPMLEMLKLYNYRPNEPIRFRRIREHPIDTVYINNPALPPLPETLKVLQLEGGYDIPGLHEGLQELRLNLHRPTVLPPVLPQSLVNLEFMVNDYTHIENPLPDSILKLTISRTQPPNYPNNLEELTINRNL